MAYNEPNVKDKTLTGELDKDLLDFLTELRHNVERDDEDRANWKMKMVAAANQRLGVKRRIDSPYPNAPDIPLPETDKLIKKALPNLVLSAWSPKKLCTVQVEDGVKETPEYVAKAKKAESAMNLILRTKMDLFRKLLYAADYLKEKGHCIFRVIEEFNSRKVHKVIDLTDYNDNVVATLKKAKDEQLKQFLAQRYALDINDEEDEKTISDVIKQFRKGEDIIEFDITEISSMPNIEIPLPTKIIVPTYTTDINKATRITYEYYKSKHEIEQLMESGVFIEKDLDELSFVTKDDDDIIEKSKGYNEGIDDSAGEDEVYRIHEICTWYKPKGEDCYQRWVFTFMADCVSAEDALLQRIPFPFEFDGWNYEKCDNELKDPRYYNARGTPEQIRAIQEMMERALNNLLIRDEMNNNPSYEVLNTSDILDAHLNFVPGELIPVKQIGTEIRRINDPISVDVSSQSIMQMLKAYAEEYVGNIDQLFRNATNTGGGKTLGEVREGIRATSGMLDVEVLNFTECLTRVYRKVFAIMKERLGDSIFVQGQEVTREDFNFPADIRCNGNLELADKELATQKAWMRLSAIANPAFSDIVNSEDKYNALRDWLEKDGIKDPDVFCTNPMEIAQSQIRQMQQQMQQMGMQLQQGQKAIAEQQKEIAKNQKRGQEVVKKTQGQLEAITGL